MIFRQISSYDYLYDNETSFNKDFWRYFPEVGDYGILTSGLDVRGEIDLENYSKKCIDIEGNEWYFLQYLKHLSEQRMVSGDNPYYDIMSGDYVCYFKMDNIDFSNYDPDFEADKFMITIENNVKYEKLLGGIV